LCICVNAALAEIMEEGGQPARLARYEANAEELHSGMAKLGFTTYLSPDKQGCIISTFRESPATPRCAPVRGGCCMGQAFAPTFPDGRLTLAQE
jgi:aspartate aminotransferase-like enzyme